jgi:N-acetylneuraminate synthase
MTSIEIDGRPVGDGHPCYIIAEACDNHLGSLTAALEMVRQARACGADAIKFQHHLPDEEMLPHEFPSSPNFTEPLYEFLRKHALTLEQHRTLQEHCRQLGITYLCTPFSKAAALELHELGVPAFKIGSGELTDLPTLRVIARLGRPVILSTGMAEWPEIAETVETIRPLNPAIALMNCTSEYPAQASDVNLGVIDALKSAFGVPVGHSDHTPDIYTCIGAVARGANLVEKHFILDKRQPGPDQSVSIDAHDLAQLVRAVRQVEQALGREKRVHDLERPIHRWARRSVVSLVDIPRGTRITESMVWTKRPGTGIPARDLDRIVGRVARVDVPAHRLLSWDDVSESAGRTDG